jgi:hypothetical protein
MPMKKHPAIAARRPQLDNDQAVPDELTGRLYQATENTVGDLVAGLSLAQRANLAMFCYRKAHLRRVGLAIAATCDRSALVLAWGQPLGHALFEQSRNPAAEPAGRADRSPITLAKSCQWALNAWEQDAEDAVDWAIDETTSMH